MTVIAWDGTTLAADKRAVANNMRFNVTKIKKIRGHLVFSAGDFDSANMLFKWFEDGAKPDSYPTCQNDKDRWVVLIVITPDKQILRYEKEPVSYVIEEPFAAVGSGRDYAMAAMAMGANAIEAVKIACQFDIYCGDGIDTLTLGVE
jgi:ATP-dependent protease HslVU (ClpYQ) peptidase subunit